MDTFGSSIRDGLKRVLDCVKVGPQGESCNSGRGRDNEEVN